MIIYGITFYGECDRVEGLGHVSTKFFHLYYVPVIPLGSFFVVRDTGDGVEGKDVALCGKSVLLGYAEGLCLALTLSGIIVAIASRAWRLLGVGMVAGGIGLFCAMRFAPGLRTASYTRARELATEIGLSPAGLIAMEVWYGKLTEDEAAQELQRLADEQAERKAARAEELERRKEARKEEVRARNERAKQKAAPAARKKKRDE